MWKNGGGTTKRRRRMLSCPLQPQPPKPVPAEDTQQMCEYSSKHKPHWMPTVYESTPLRSGSSDAIAVYHTRGDQKFLKVVDNVLFN